jgi:hypothetical protein
MSNVLCTSPTRRKIIVSRSTFCYARSVWLSTGIAESPVGKGLKKSTQAASSEVVRDINGAWNRFGPVIEAEVKDQRLRGGVPRVIVPADEDGITRLRGTISLVLQKDFSSSLQPDPLGY